MITKSPLKIKSAVFENPWFRFVSISALLIISVWFLYYLRSIFLPLVLALLVAYVLDPIVTKLSRRGLPRGAVAAFLVFILVILFFLLLIFFIPKLFNQFIALAQNIPKYVEDLKSYVEPLIKKFKTDYPGEVEKIAKSVSSEVEKKLPDIAGWITNLTLNMFSNILSFILGFIKLIILPIFTFFLLKDINNIKKWIKRYLPYRYRDQIVSLFREIDNVLGKYLRGQLLICIIVGTYYSIGFIFINVPFGLLFGILIGIVNFVPYMGVFVGVIPAILLTLAENASMTKIIAILLLYLAQQIWDGMYLTPSVLGHRVGLNPVIILLSLMIFGKLFGIMGILVAVPSAAVLKVLFHRILHNYEAKQLALAAADSSGQKSKKRKVES